MNTLNLIKKEYEEQVLKYLKMQLESTFNELNKKGYEIIFFDFSYSNSIDVHLDLKTNICVAKTNVYSSKKNEFNKIKSKALQELIDSVEFVVSNLNIDIVDTIKVTKNGVTMDLLYYNPKLEKKKKM